MSVGRLVVPRFVRCRRNAARLRGTFRAGLRLSCRIADDANANAMKTTLRNAALALLSLLPALSSADPHAGSVAQGHGAGGAADRPYEFIPGLDTQYSRSASTVFHWTCSSAPQLTSRQCWQALPGIEPQTFSPVSFIPDEDRAAEPSQYSKDSRGVYYNDVRVDADPATFKVLSRNWASTDGGVMYAGVARPEIDAASLQVLEHGWARDKNSVYYSGAAVKDADPASLRVLNAHYALDKAHVFHRADAIATPQGPADAASFQVLGNGGYAKDAKSVYHQGQRIADADRASFVLIDTQTNDCYARDSHRVYYCGRPVALGDTESFVVLDSFFAIDNERVYFDGAAVAAADRNTFRHFQPEDAPPTEVRVNAEDERNWYEVVASDLVVTPKTSHQGNP